MGALMIGYDVEDKGPGPITAAFLERASEIHSQLGVPATLFVVGRTLEQNVAEFQAVAREKIFDIQQHTYSHKLLKTVYIDNGESIHVVRGIGLDEIKDEISRANGVLSEVLGIDCMGLTGPWGYYRGLRDRPDILEILREEGIRFCRTDSRNEHDWHPVSMDLQPYWYEPVGFPEILEIPTHGWHDCVIRESVVGWENLEGWVNSVKPYLDRAAATGEIFSHCQHDWSSTRADPRMTATEEILSYALEIGLRIISYHDYYEERLRGRAQLADAAT